MKLRFVLLFSLCLCFLFWGCRKKNDTYPGNLKGIVVYKSCVTTVVRITNEEMGVSWTNCHDGQRYKHVIDAYLADSSRVLNTGDVINFDVVPGTPVVLCKMLDCAPSLPKCIVLR